MPSSPTEVYFPVLVQAVIAMALAAGLLTVSYLLGKRVRNRVLRRCICLWIGVGRKLDRRKPATLLIEVSSSSG